MEVNNHDKEETMKKRIIDSLIEFGIIWHEPKGSGNKEIKGDILIGDFLLELKNHSKPNLHKAYKEAKEDATQFQVPVGVSMMPEGKMLAVIEVGDLFQIIRKGIAYDQLDNIEREAIDISANKQEEGKVKSKRRGKKQFSLLPSRSFPKKQPFIPNEPIQF